MEVKLNCIAIDDEPLALELIEDDISKIPFLNLIGSFNSPLDAFSLLNEDKVDLMFLDIQMPDVTGLEFLKSLHKKPMVIITTAYDKYAIDGFNLDVIDYVVKPIPFDRFLKAVLKAQEFYQIKNKKNSEMLNSEVAEKDFIFLKSGYDIIKVVINDIEYVEGLKDYVTLHVKGKQIISLYNLKTFLSKLPEDRFIRVHRSFIVALDKIEAIKKGKIVIGKKEIPIGDHYKEDLEKKISEHNF